MPSRSATTAARITLPAVIDPTMVDGVVWLPARAPGHAVAAHLASSAGDLVTISPGALATTDNAEVSL